MTADVICRAGGRVRLNQGCTILIRDLAIYVRPCKFRVHS